MTYRLEARFPDGRIERTATTDLSAAHIMRVVWQSGGGKVVTSTVYEHDQNEVRT